MKQLPLLLLLTLSVSCENRKPEVQANARSDSLPPAYVPIDTSDKQPFRIVIQEGKVEVPLSASEMSFADSLLEQQIEEYNRKSDKRLSIDLSKYRRQYFPFVDTNGEKKVEINCFCQVHNNDDWKQTRVRVKDGGNCYFNLTISLTKRLVSDFYVNGEA